MADYEQFSAALTDVLRETFSDAQVSVERLSDAGAEKAPRQAPQLSFADGAIRVQVYAGETFIDYLDHDPRSGEGADGDRPALVVDLVYRSLAAEDDLIFNLRALHLPAEASGSPQLVADALADMVDLLRQDVGEFDEEQINAELTKALAAYDAARASR